MTSIVITSEMALSVSLIEDSAFGFSLNFFGKDSAESVLADSFSDSIWTLSVFASAPSHPGSSGNADSQIFFSDSPALLPFPFVALLTVGNAQCEEHATFVFSLPTGWFISEETSYRLVLMYAGPSSYSYSLALTFPSETVASWSYDDESSLLADLQSFYNDETLSFIIETHEDVDGQLVITITVIGFSNLEAAVTSHDSVQANGIAFETTAFADVTTVASDPVLGCQVGYSTENGVCIDTDGCNGNSCGHGVCIDTAAPGSGYSCTCDEGYFDETGTCEDIDGCSGNTCGSHGSCVDSAAPGVGISHAHTPTERNRKIESKLCYRSILLRLGCFQVVTLPLVNCLFPPMIIVLFHISRRRILLHLFDGLF